MSLVEPGAPPITDPLLEVEGSAGVRPARVGRVVMRWVRRGHLYLGLFLFPWAVLYGVTAFLFNHPNAFADQPSLPFGREELVGTPMESPPTPEGLARQVVEALQRRADQGSEYTLIEPAAARFTRDFAFATARTAEGEQVSILLDVLGGGGTIRVQSTRPRGAPAEPAPFAVGPSRMGSGRETTKGARRGKAPSRPGTGDALELSEPLRERVRAAITTVLERKEVAAGDLVVTSVPDLTFRMDADGTAWTVHYNAMTGSVTGKKADEADLPSLGVRRFLTRMHLAHGYPASLGARWVWALVVDAMAFVMVFWGVSGLFMWWQIKATRGWGAVTLLSSLAFAVTLAWGMYRVFVS